MQLNVASELWGPGILQFPKLSVTEEKNPGVDPTRD
jgi:hypothetical protein